MNLGKLFVLFAALSFPGFPLCAQTGNGTVSGKILDTARQPVQGAAVKFKGLSAGTSASADGSFSLSVPAGTYELVVSMIGYEQEGREVRVEGGKEIRLDPLMLREAVVGLTHEVRVIGKTEARQVKEQAFNVNVIDARQLYNTSSDLNQVLNRTAGVRIREDGGVGSNFNFSLNGFSGRQVKFFLDGIPMDNFGSSLTLNNFPATMAERIEIYKGVLPVSLGADALGGAVNLVTRSNPNYLDLSYGYGSFNTHKAGFNMAYTNPKNGFTVRANAFYNYSDNNYKVEVRPIDLITGQRGPLRKVRRFHDQYNSAGAQAEVGLTDRKFADKLLIGMILSGNDKDIQTGVTMEQVFGARRAISNSFIPTLKYKKTDLLASGLDLNLYGAFNITDNRFVDTTRLKYNWLRETIPTTMAELSRTQLVNTDKEALLSANLSYRLSDLHTISYNYILTDFKRSSSDVENPGNITFLFPQRLRKQNMGLAWQTNYGSFSATAFGKLYLLRAESFENVTTGSIAEYQPTSMERNNTGYGIAASYFILPRLQAKASFEHTYRLPEAIEVLGDGLYVRRNSGLRPENSNNINLGGLYSLRFGDLHKVDFDANFIYRYSKDYIRQDQQQVQPVDRQYINVGEVKTTGGEAEIRYSWKNRIFGSLNATYQDIIDRTEWLYSSNLTGTTRSRNLNYGYRLPNLPYFFGNANAGMRIHPSGTPGNVVSLNYGLNYVAKYYLTPNHIGAGNDDIIPAQILHNFTIDYTLKDGRYTVTFECKNLTDARLYDNYLLQKPGRSFFVRLRFFMEK